MYRIVLTYKDGSMVALPVTYVRDTVKIYEILTEDPNVVTIDIYNPDGKIITDQRYDQE